MREFGLLRSLGASRGQVLRSVVLEALLVGAVASILGLFAGLGIAWALEGLFTLAGSDLPSGTLVIAARTVVVALLTGTMVTLVAGLLPAMRAMGVPPIAALREGAALPRSRFARYTPILTAIVTAAGLLLVCLGIFASIASSNDRLLVLGVGALLLFLGVAMLSPRLIRPLAGVLGWPTERFSRVTGLLARDNTVRNPSRTAVTAAALMIGLALVSFVTIFAAELRQTADASINREVTGGIAIYNDNSNPIPEGVAAAATRVRGVQTASAVKETGGGIRGYGTVQVNGIQPATLLKVYRFQWKEGSPASITTMGPYDAVVEQALGRKLKLHLGSHLRVRTGNGAIRRFTVRGIYKTVQFRTDLTIRYDTVRRDWGLEQDAAVVVSAMPGRNLSMLETRLAKAVQGPYPTATVHSEAEFKAQQTRGINQELELIYVLLAMSLIVSLFGIVNTLALSVYERTREIGMLRAIGTTRSQIRWIVRWESVITSLIGAVLGVILGFALAILVTAGLSSQAIQYAFPVGQLLIWVAVAVVLGIVAAAWPARLAARMDVLRALAYE